MKKKKRHDDLYEQEDFLIEYTGHILGEDFFNVIKKPEDYQIGERVVYKLKGGRVAERHEMTPSELEEDQGYLEEIAEKTGSTIAETHPPVSSGLPYPRLVDIPGWDIIFDIPLKKYLISNELLPKLEFSIEWLLGLYFGYSEKMLAYIDFIHPKVKGIFCGVYEEEGSLSSRLKEKLNRQFWEFYNNLTHMQEKADTEEFGYEWVKIVNSGSDFLMNFKNKND